MQTTREPDRQTVWLLTPEPETLGTAAARVLLWGDDGARGATLPRLSLPREMWVADGVGELSEQAEALLGVRTTTLRHLVDLDGAHVCEAELHVAQWRPPDGSRWATLDELRAVYADEWSAPPEKAEAIERWFGEQSGAAPVPAIRPRWERRGWLDEVLAWADRALDRHGIIRTGWPIPRKGAWSGSAILKLPTSAGDVYLKTAYTRPPGEAALVAALHARWPEVVPDVLAWDAAHNVMLMRDFGRGALMDERGGAPVPRWENAARAFGQLQLDCSAHLDRWLEMGVEDRRLTTLRVHFARLMADRPYLWLEHTRGLTPEQVTSIEQVTPRLMEMVEELDASGLPASLVQQDFRHGNLAVVPLGEAGPSTHRFIFYDWGDAVLSHPFFSGTRMLDYLRKPYETTQLGPSGVPGRMTLSRAAFHRYLRDAYVEPWTAQLPATQLRAAFELARKLNPLWQTIRWWLEIPYYETTSPWGKESLTWGPHHLRWVLKTLEEDGAQANYEQ
jgi:hypothetical protein